MGWAVDRGPPSEIAAATAFRLRFCLCAYIDSPTCRRSILKLHATALKEFQQMESLPNYLIQLLNEHDVAKLLERPVARQPPNARHGTRRVGRGRRGDHEHCGARFSRYALALL